MRIGIDHAPGAPRPTPRLLLLLVVLLGGLAFAPALGNGFAFDDTLASSKTNAQHVDRMIAEFHPPWVYFAAQYWEGEERDSTLYRPLTIYSYALTYHLLARPLLPAEFEALPHHLINLLLNMWAVYLVFWMLRDLRVCRLGALLTAAMFGVHAVHSEVVAGIVGRAELLSLCLGLVGLKAWRRAERGPRRGWVAGAGAAFLLALWAKESAVAWLVFLPCYLLAQAWLARLRDPATATATAATAATATATAAPGGAVLAPLRSQVRQLLWVIGVVLAVFLVMRGVAIAGHSQDVFYAANPLYHEPVAVRLLTAIKLWGFGLYKCVAPFSLACLYSLQAVTLVDSPLDPAFLGGLAVVILGLVLGLWRPWRWPRLFLAVALFFGFSCITSNVPFAIGTIFGERLYFIPSLGVCMLPALLLPRLPAWGRRLVVTGCVVWIVACVQVDLQRSVVWRDNQTLMLHDADAQPDCASLQLKAATTYHWLARTSVAGKDEYLAQAWRYLRRAQALDPEFVDAAATEATFLGHAGDRVGAIAVLRRALGMKRLPICGLEAGMHGSLGMFLIETGRSEEGLAGLQRAVALAPRGLDWRFALLEHGIGPLPPGDMQAVLVEGLEQVPGNLLMQTLQAHWIYTYAEITQTNAEHIVRILTAVFKALAAAPTTGPTTEARTEATTGRAAVAPIERPVEQPVGQPVGQPVEQPVGQPVERRFVHARLQLAQCQQALGQVAAARANLELVIAAAHATPQLVEQARTALAALRDPSPTGK